MQHNLSIQKVNVKQFTGKSPGFIGDYALQMEHYYRHGLNKIDKEIQFKYKFMSYCQLENPKLTYFAGTDCHFIYNTESEQIIDEHKVKINGPKVIKLPQLGYVAVTNNESTHIISTSNGIKEIKKIDHQEVLCSDLDSKLVIAKAHVTKPKPLFQFIIYNETMTTEKFRINLSKKNSNFGAITSTRDYIVAQIDLNVNFYSKEDGKLAKSIPAKIAFHKLEFIKESDILLVHTYDKIHSIFSLEKMDFILEQEENNSKQHFIVTHYDGQLRIHHTDHSGNEKVKVTLKNDKLENLKEIDLKVDMKALGKRPICYVLKEQFVIISCEKHLWIYDTQLNENEQVVYHEEYKLGDNRYSITNTDFNLNFNNGSYTSFTRINTTWSDDHNDMPEEHEKFKLFEIEYSG